jgi:NTE family protein
MKEKVAIVLGGGSIKGAYQFGQLKALIESGIEPAIITGISVGAINAAAYGNFLYFNGGDYCSALTDLERMWLSIKRPSDIIKKKNPIVLGYEILFKRFKSFLSTEPLEQLIKNNLSPTAIKLSGLEISVGSVDIDKGRIIYKKQKSSNFLDYVIASTRIPFIMPLSNINGTYFYDGGLIDNAGIGEAIKLGATKIYVLATHPPKITKSVKNKKNLFELIPQVMEIVVANTLDNDIKLTKLYNCFNKTQLKALKKKKIELNVFRPSKNIDVNIEDFDSSDIRKMILQGYKDVENGIKGN